MRSRLIFCCAVDVPPGGLRCATGAAADNDSRQKLMNASTFAARWRRDGKSAYNGNHSSDQSGKRSTSKRSRITCSTPISITWAMPPSAVFTQKQRSLGFGRLQLHTHLYLCIVGRRGEHACIHPCRSPFPFHRVRQLMVGSALARHVSVCKVFQLQAPALRPSNDAFEVLD
jgi:hypothetical protein